MPAIARTPDPKQDPEEPVKLQLTVPFKVRRQLNAHAEWEDRTPSDIVIELILSHLPNYTITRTLPGEKGAA